MKVDIYDFDKTIVPYDSAFKYFIYCLGHYPWIAILIPFQIIWGFLAKVKLISIHTFKKYCFNFVALINTKKSVTKFWDKHEKDVYDFFKNKNELSKNPVVLISASPAFLIEEIAKRLNIEYCIATHHKETTGILLDENICRKEEKVKRFNALNLNAEVENVFSDSLENDKYIFNLGNNCYLATKGILKKFDKKELHM